MVFNTFCGRALYHLLCWKASEIGGGLVRWPTILKNQCCRRMCPYIVFFGFCNGEPVTRRSLKTQLKL